MAAIEDHGAFGVPSIEGSDGRDGRDGRDEPRHSGVDIGHGSLLVAEPTQAAGLPTMTVPDPPSGMLDLDESIPIGDVVWRHRAQISGRVRSIRVRPWGEIPTLEAVVADATGALTVAFLGRRSIPGITLGCPFTAEGMVGDRDGKLVILNPAYDLRPVDR